MKKNRDFDKIKEKIYLITKKLIEKNIQEELPFFETSWDEFLNLLIEWENTHPQEWPFSNYQRTTFPYLPSPDQFRKLKMQSIGLTVSATIYDLLRSDEKPIANKIEEIARIYTDRFGSPDSLIPDIVSLLIKSVDILNLEAPEEEEDAHDIPEEKKEYWIYSHKHNFGTDISKEEIDELENLSYKQIGKQYDIYFFTEKNEILIKGKPKRFSGKKGKPKSNIRRLLILFLTNVGDKVYYTDIVKEVWGNKDKSPNDIHQLKLKVCEFTDGILSPFITSDDEIFDPEKKFYYVNARDKNENLFRYCLIIRPGLIL